ncbi:hypothetical protein Shyhy01_32550 [Streptomyces hygroscopicus subsp. hygroscopicus]|nr:hypothetical protein Shyhy01_32550 [Streptomyces hygroscopicus subsp. hygroscopicus]
MIWTNAEVKGYQRSRLLAVRSGPGCGTVEYGVSLRPKEPPMTNHTYRVTEIVGTSHEGVDQAIRNGIARAGRTLRNLDWFEVTQIRGQLENGQIEHYQVGLKVGFRIEDGD